MEDLDKVLHDLARKTMFELTDKEMDHLKEEYIRLNESVDILNTIDTESVEPLAFPYEVETTFLRDDEEIYKLEREDALSNASSIQDGQVKVPKVVG